LETTTIPPDVSTDWVTSSIFVSVLISPVLTGGCGLLRTVVGDVPVVLFFEVPHPDKINVKTTKIDRGHRNPFLILQTLIVFSLIYIMFFFPAPYL
jgi:phosphate/sulfate permease